jgi:hypothetical protein
VTLDDLEAVLAERRSADPAQSYTARLLADPELVRRKIRSSIPQRARRWQEWSGSQPRRRVVGGSA